MPIDLSTPTFLGKITDTLAPAALGTWLEAGGDEPGLAWAIDPGTLSVNTYITADALLDDTNVAVFDFRLYDLSDNVFRLRFGIQPQCQARWVLPLSATNQNRWMLPRRAAMLKPLCSGQRVNPVDVVRIELRLIRSATVPVRFCLSTLELTDGEPPTLTDPLLPKGPLLDALGQYTLRNWPGKTESVDALTARLRKQAEDAAGLRWPAAFARYGGSSELPTLQATGFFRTEYHGSRWWLVDPEGHLFWSAGIDCVNPRTETNVENLESACAWLPDPDSPFASALAPNHARPHVNFLIANFIRAFGDQWRPQWNTITLAQLRALGFNTVGNWSDWQTAAAAGFPHVRPLDLQLPNTPRIYRDFPDVFDPAFAGDAATFAEQLKSSVGDPSLIGYFLMNEPTWGFAEEALAAGMLFNAPSGPARKHLAEFLRQRHGTDGNLSTVWGVSTTFIALAHNPFNGPLNAAAQRDLADFSTVLVERFFSTLSAACRAVDPNHLNLGARYHTVPPAWALAGMTSFDVFSLNAYKAKPDAEALSKISRELQRPVMIGEYHHGSLDSGLPASGIGHVRTQADRGRAYRYYMENAAAHPACIGAHYFQLYDQSALGRFDGENYQIGFLDVTNRPYGPLAEAARAAHEQLYRVASQQTPPFNDPPEYLPLLFF